MDHINGCLKIKKEKANRKKAAREARERAKEQALRVERERRAEEEGITLGGDGDSGDDDDDEKGPGGKSTKKVAGKKAGDGDSKGKKRKADGEADKGPKQKKKKDEPKPKTKPKGGLPRGTCRSYMARLKSWTVCLIFVNAPTAPALGVLRPRTTNQQHHGSSKKKKKSYPIPRRSDRKRHMLTRRNFQVQLTLRDNAVSYCPTGSPAPDL